MTRSLIRVLIGLFLAYMGYEAAKIAYQDDMGFVYYIPAGALIAVGIFFALYYYKQHKIELERGPIDEDDEDDNSEN